MVAAAYGGGPPAGDAERRNCTQLGGTERATENNRGGEKLRKSRGLRAWKSAAAQVLARGRRVPILWQSWSRVASALRNPSVQLIFPIGFWSAVSGRLKPSNRHWVR